MTREKLVDMMYEDIDGVHREALRKAADRILAALEDEKKGEVVLLELPVDDTDGIIGDTLEGDIQNINMTSKKGQLIFRPDTGEDKGGK